MSIVIENLKEAIKGESNAKRKYELFAERADKENLPEISHLFKAVSIAESIHIKNHLKALSVITHSTIKLEEIVIINEEELKKKTDTTKSNLLDAIEGEIYETKKMYKTFVKNSKKNNNDVAELSFTLAKKAEKVHANLFRKYHKFLIEGKPIIKVDLFICQICGNVELNKAPLICPICDHDQKFFNKL